MPNHQLKCLADLGQFRPKRAPSFPKPLDPDTTGESARFNILEAMVIALAEEAW